MPGPAPKPADQRARRNKDPIPVRVVEVTSAPQPKLPKGVDWHPQTLAWWKMWGDSPLSDSFTANDWNELVDTAIIHSAFWNGDVKLAGELRLRVAKFGATPEDRARLRITFATADTAESKKRKAAMTAAERRRLRVVGE
jgi:hypothetical protein